VQPSVVFSRRSGYPTGSGQTTPSWYSITTSMRPRKHNRDLPPCVFLRSGTYYHVKAGKWRNLGRDRYKALAEYARLEAQSVGGMAALITEALPHILKDKAQATQSQYTVAARRLSEILAEFSPAQVTSRDVAQIRRSFPSYSVANRTITVLRLVFDYALEEQLVSANPCTGIKRLAQNVRTRLLLPAEFAAIKACAKPRLQAVMSLCYLTGQRIGDVLAIKRTDLQADGIYVEQEKTGAKLLVAWTPELRQAVDQAKALHGKVAGPYLVKGTVGSEGKPLPYKVIWKDWKAACAAAGVTGANIHDLRAMSGTEAEKQGHDPQALLGHTDKKMTQRYLRDKQIPVVHGPSIGSSNTPRKKNL
jgi:integrase